MINKDIEIKNFKSIRDLKFNCKRVNVFIGKPNSGKTNILEAVGLLGLSEMKLSEYVRFETLNDLFYDENTEKQIHIKLANYSFFLRYERDQFIGGISDTTTNIAQGILTFTANYNSITSFGLSASTKVMYYRFDDSTKYESREKDYLSPVRGNNLVFLFKINKKLRTLAADLLKEFGFRLVLEPQTNSIKIQKEVDDIVITYPYYLVSDTLRRLIFHIAAIETNDDSFLIFDEPEAFAFPYYVKYIAERIGIDEKNRYFIATHNPYFLMPLIQKTDKENISVNIVYYDNYQTKIKQLTSDILEEIQASDHDVFLNIDRFVEK